MKIVYENGQPLVIGDVTGVQTVPVYDESGETVLYTQVTIQVRVEKTDEP